MLDLLKNVVYEFVFASSAVSRMSNYCKKAIEETISMFTLPKATYIVNSLNKLPMDARSQSYKTK